MTFVVESFAGNDLQTAVYKARLLANDRPLTRSGQQIRTQPPGTWARHVRVEQSPRQLVVYVQVLSGTINDGLRSLQQWFAVGTEGALVVTEDGTSKAIDCVVTGNTRYVDSNDTFIAVLMAADPRFRAESASSDSEAVTATGQTWTVANAGNVYEDKPTITLKPTSNKTAANGWLYREFVTVAWKATRGSGGPYAIDVTDGGWDHAAEVTATRSLSSGNDVRVFVDGVEVPRWAGEAASTTWNQATTKVWANVAFSPRKVATLLSAATAGSPANNADLTVVKGGTVGWPRSGALLIDDEVITYTGITESNASGLAAFTGITRGARGTTAASHSANASIYWVEHDIQVLHGYTGASAPESRDDLKPMLDLTSTNLTNSRHVWADFADSRYPGRSMQWIRALSALDSRYTNILAATDGPLTSMVLEYQSDGPVAGEPNFNIWRRPFPTGTADSGTLLSCTHVVNDTLALIVTGFDDDGNQTTLDTIEGAVASSTLTISAPTSPLYDLRFRGRSLVTLAVPDGVRQNNIAVDSSPAYTTAGSQQFTIPDDGFIYGAMVYMNNAGALTAVSLWTDNGSDAPGERMSDEATAASPGALAWGTVTFSSPIPVYANQKIWLRMYSNTASATWRGYYGVYGGGVSGTTGVVLKSRLLSSDIDIEALAEADDGDQITLDAMDVRLDTDGVPYIAMGSRQNCYRFYNAEVSNNTTGESVTLDVVCALNDEIEIDIGAGSAQIVSTGESVLNGIEFSDSQNKIRLAPGNNTFEYTEAGVVAVSVTTDYYGRWE